MYLNSTNTSDAFPVCLAKKTCQKVYYRAKGAFEEMANTHSLDFTCPASTLLRVLTWREKKIWEDCFSKIEGLTQDVLCRVVCAILSPPRVSIKESQVKL